MKVVFASYTHRNCHLVCVYTYTHTHRSVNMYIQIYILYICTQIYTYMNMYIYTNTQTRVYKQFFPIFQILSPYANALVFHHKIIACIKLNQDLFRLSCT